MSISVALWIPSNLKRHKFCRNAHYGRLRIGCQTYCRNWCHFGSGRTQVATLVSKVWQIRHGGVNTALDCSLWWFTSNIFLKLLAPHQSSSTIKTTKANTNNFIIVRWVQCLIIVNEHFDCSTFKYYIKTWTSSETMAFKMYAKMHMVDEKHNSVGIHVHNKQHKDL